MFTYDVVLLSTRLAYTDVRLYTIIHVHVSTSSSKRFAWYNWIRTRSTLLSIRLDSYFGLVGPHQQPVIDSNVDPSRNHLYQASAPAAGIRDSNVMPPAASYSKYQALKFSSCCFSGSFQHLQCRCLCRLFHGVSCLHQFLCYLPARHRS